MLCFMLLCRQVQWQNSEHNNGRLNTIGLGPIGPTTPPATHDDLRFPRAFWNFMFEGKVPELYGTS